MSDGWAVQVLTGAPASYSEGTALDHELLRLVPEEVDVVRAGVVRGLDRLSRIVRPVRDWWRGDRRVAVPGVPLTTPRPARPRGVRAFIEQLCAIPDNESGWLVGAVSRGVAAGLRTRPDVIYSSAPPWTGQVVAYAIASALGCRWVADFRDPWARAPWREDRPPMATRAARRLERLVTRRADALLFTTGALRDEMVRHYGPWLAPKCHVVRNGCDPAEFSALPIGERDGCFTLAHVGSLYGGRDPVTLLRAIAAALRSGAVDRRRFKLRLIGQVALADRNLASTCEELGLADVVDLVPRVGRRESLAAMASADSLLLIQPGHPLSVPGKFFEYLAAGKPILAVTDEGETAELVRATGTGLVASPSSEHAIRDALAAIVQGRFVASPASATAYDGRLRAREMVAVLESLLAAQPHRRALGNLTREADACQK